jgi:hypothetical protein
MQFYACGLDPHKMRFGAGCFFLLPADASAPKLAHQTISAQAHLKINPELTFASALLPSMVPSPPVSRSGRWCLGRDLLRLPLSHMLLPWAMKAQSILAREHKIWIQKSLWFTFILHSMIQNLFTNNCHSHSQYAFFFLIYLYISSPHFLSTTTVDTFFCQYTLDPSVIYGVTNTPTSQALARRNGFLKKPNLVDFSLHWRRVPAVEIWPTSIQGTSGRGKAGTVDSGACGGGDGWEEEEELEIEGATLTLTLKIDKRTIDWLLSSIFFTIGRDLRIYMRLDIAFFKNQKILTKHGENLY